MSLDYKKDFYILTVRSETGEEIKIPSTEFRHNCHTIESIYGIEYITKVSPRKGFYDIYLDKPYAIIPSEQDKLEEAFDKMRENYKNKILHALNEPLDNGDSDFESVKRGDAQDIPERYGLRIRTITKSDIQRLLRGDILYWADEYTFIIGMSDENIEV